LLTFNVLSVSAAERRRDWGILRSQGATRPQITALLLAEAMALGLIGGALGLPLAYALVRLSAGPIQRVLSELVLPLTEIRVDLSLSTWLNGLFVGVTAAIFAAIIPAVQTARLDPIAALRRIDELPHRPLLWRSLIPTVAIALAGGAIHECAPHSTSGTWASLFFLVVAILFLTPQLTRLLGFLLRPAVRRWAGVAFTLALDNLLRWPRRYGLAAATLAGGTALLMQTGGVIRSNEDAVRDWLDRSVIGDLFVTSGGPLSASGQNLPMRDSLADPWRQRIPGLRIVPMRFRHVDWRQGDHSARILLVLLDAPAYRSMIEERFPDLPDRRLYQLLSEQPDAALVSRNFAALHNLNAGDRLVLPSMEGPKTFRILGCVADYSCMQGTVLIDRSRHARAFDGSMADVWSVTVPAGVDIDRARQELQESSGGFSESLFVVTHEEMRSHALGMIRRLYGVAVAQQSLVAFASILGVAAAMAISVLQRSGELGTLRGLGATRFQMIRFVLAESFMVGLLGTVAGLLLGIPLEWFMVKVVLLSETGFVFPMRMPWGVAIIGGLLTPACAALGGLAPALTAARINSAGVVACE
jgi:putative ABC transport system permease protein